MSRLKKFLNVAWLFCGLTFIPSAFCQEPVWCAKPVGAAIRDEVRRQDSASIAFAQSFVASGGTYVYLKKVGHSTELTAERTLFRAQMTAEGHTGYISDQELNEIFEKADQEAILNGEKKATGYWFVDTNSEALKNAFRNKVHFDITHGGVLEMTPEIESRFLTDYKGDGTGGLIDVISRVVTPDFILIETSDSLPRNLSVRRRSSGPLIMQLRPGSVADSLGGKVNLFQQLVHSDPRKTVVVNLLPTRPDQAQEWGFEQHKSEEYAVNGKRISDDLRRYGFSVAKDVLSTKEAVMTKIMDAGQGNINVILIGEAGPNGVGVRLPSSSAILTDLDLKPLQGRVTLTGLVCNSDQTITGPNSASVAGTLFTDETRTFLRMAFDTREAASMSEFIGLPVSSTHLTDTISKSFDSLKTVQFAVVLMSGSVQGLVSRAASSGDAGGTGSSSSGTSNSDRGSNSGDGKRDHNTGTLVISALVGGAARTFAMEEISGSSAG